VFSIIRMGVTARQCDFRLMEGLPRIACSGRGAGARARHSEEASGGGLVQPPCGGLSLLCMRLLLICGLFAVFWDNSFADVRAVQRQLLHRHRSNVFVVARRGCGSNPGRYVSTAIEMRFWRTFRAMSPPRGTERGSWRLCRRSAEGALTGDETAAVASRKVRQPLKRGPRTAAARRQERGRSRREGARPAGA
jgi:hypothetical protein